MPASLALIARKPSILEDAQHRIMGGETLAQIALSHKIDTKTLNTWLLSLGESYLDLRQAYIDTKLVECGQSIEEASDTFPLARAREAFRYWSWIAERRDQRYAAKQEVNHGVSIHVTVNRGVEDRAVTIEHESQLSISDDSQGENAAK